MRVTISFETANSSIRASNADGVPFVEAVAATGVQKAQEWIDQHYDADTDVLAATGHGVLRDLNGNTVGSWSVVAEEPCF